MSMDANTIETGSAIDMGTIRGVITALTMAVFYGIAWWAYHRGNRERFEEDALIPFSEDDLFEAPVDREVVDREGSKP
jgi:cytochrome c oxidase cbb3-type subunit 4